MSIRESRKAAGRSPCPPVMVEPIELAAESGWGLPGNEVPLEVPSKSPGGQRASGRGHGERP